MRLSASSFGIVMNAGPASVSPYELITDACGMRAWSFVSVAGASGALPIETAIGAERSADSNRGHEEDHHRMVAFDDVEPMVNVEARHVQAGEPHLHRVEDEAHAREREERRAVKPTSTRPRGRHVGDHRDVAMPN